MLVRFFSITVGKVTLAGVKADKRFKLAAPEMTCFGTLGVGDRVRAAVLLGCDVFGGVSGVTPRVINDNHRNLSVFIATYDEELKWSLAVAIDALLYMPVHDSAGAKVYSIGAPKRLSAMLRQFAIGTIAIDPIDTAVHTECDCGRIFDQYLCCNAWTECAECMLWLCSVCITVHDCTTPRDAWSATRLVKFDELINDALHEERPTMLRPSARNLPSEQLVPTAVNVKLIDYATPDVLRNYLRFHVCGGFCFVFILENRK